MDSSQDEQARRPTAWARRFVRGLNTSVAGNSQAFGFSIAVTVTFGVVSSAQGNPSTAELMGFAMSAVAAFSVLNLVVARLMRTEPCETESTRVLLIATATDFLAVGAAVGAAIGICHAADGWSAWVLAPLCAGVVYVLVQSIELAVGERE